VRNHLLNGPMSFVSRIGASNCPCAATAACEDEELRVADPGPLTPHRGFRPIPGMAAVGRFRLGLVLFVILIRTPSLFEPRWYSDEGFFTTVAWATARGLPLYSGVYTNQPPVILWLFSLMQAMGSLEQHLVVQLTAAVAVAVAAWLTFEVSRRFLRPWHSALAAGLTGLVLSLPVLDGDLINVEMVALPFFMGAFVLAFYQRSAPMLASGALLGVAIATRPSFALDACALAIPLLASDDRVRRLCFAACGLLLTGVLIAAALAAQGSLIPYLGEVVAANRAYLLWSNGGTLLPLLLRLIVLAAAGLFGIRKASTPAGRLAAIWLPAAAVGASLTPRELSHYCQEAIPPLAFTVALVVQRFRLRWLAVLPAALAMIAGAEAVLIVPAVETAILNGRTPPSPFLHNFSYPGLLGYYGNWLELVLTRETPIAYADRFPGSPALDRSEADFLKRQPGSSDSRLIVLGDRPWLYVEAGMLPGSRYIATDSAFWREPMAPLEMTHALSNSCAAFVVYASGPGDWQPALDTGGYTRLQGAPLPTYRTTRSPVGPGAQGACVHNP
jgi:hypothetical protein